MKIWHVFLEQASTSSWDERLSPPSDIICKVTDVYVSKFFDPFSTLTMFSQQSEDYLDGPLSAIDQYDRAVEGRFRLWKEIFQQQKEYVMLKAELIMGVLKQQRQGIAQSDEFQCNILASKLAHMMVLTGYSLFHMPNSWSYQYYLQRQINHIVSASLPETADDMFLNFKANLVITLIESSSSLIQPVLTSCNTNLKSNFLLSHFYLIFHFCLKLGENLASPDYSTSLLDLASKLPSTLPQHHPTLLSSLALSCLQLLPSLSSLPPAVPVYLLTKSLLLVTRLKQQLPAEHFLVLPLLKQTPEVLAAVDISHFAREVQEKIAELLGLCVLGDGSVDGVKSMVLRLFGAQPQTVGLPQVVGALRAANKADCSLLAVKVMYPPVCKILRDRADQLLQDERNLPHVTEFYQLLVAFAIENGEGRYGGTINLEVLHDTITIMLRICSSVNQLIRTEFETQNLDRLTEITRKASDVILSLLAAMETIVIKASREFVMSIHFRSELLTEYLQRHFELVWCLLPVIHVDLD